jgi:hypothetical protein
MKKKGGHKHYQKILRIAVKELKEHVPFTFLGAMTGIVLISAILALDVFHEVHEIAEPVFYILHPLHIFLSAMVITGLYKRYGKKRWWLALIIGVFGALFVATLSDSLFPYLGEMLLDLREAESHIGFLEQPLLTIPLAFLGVLVGYFVNATKFPHMGHVLLSTWASLFHLIMAAGEGLGAFQLIIIFFLLFVAVWIPCCLSDIVYPLIFMKKGEDIEDCLVCSHGHD